MIHVGGSDEVGVVRPELTVITVCKNAGGSLEATIASVLKQEDIRLEYIIIDGCSTDETNEILSRYRQDIDHIVSEPDHGIYDAMNKGLARASGELVFFLNAKDILFDERVAEKVVSAYRQHKAEILYGDVLISDNSGETRASYRDWDLARFFDTPLCHQGMFASREAFRICGNFNSRYKFAADQDWILKALRYHRLRAHYLPFVVAYFDGAGLTSTPGPFLRSEMHAAIDNNFNRLESLVYKVARRSRLREQDWAWNLLATIMRWKLRE